MTLKVIGAGFGRTGTLSLKLALERLGFDKCYHMMEVRHHADHIDMWLALARGESVDWEVLFEDYQASVDWPSCNFWREQMKAYPEAKVILTIRDAESWYQSVMNTIWEASKKQAAVGSAMAFEVIWDGVFNGRMEDKDYVIKQYKAHNRTVIQDVPKEKLLVFEAKEGWSALCDFLECAVPKEPYPNVNSTEDFTNRHLSFSSH